MKLSPLIWRAVCRATQPLFILLGSSVLCGCDAKPTALEITEPDAAIFASQAYPILLRDCGFPACHGNADRFFRLFGPGRVRLDPESMSDEPATQEEIAQAYARAVSMLVNEGSPEDSWLLRKPLSKDAGGSEHEGLDAWGRNVYYSKSDPSYLTLARWAQTRAEMPAAPGAPP